MIYHRVAGVRSQRKKQGVPALFGGSDGMQSWPVTCMDSSDATAFLRVRISLKCRCGNFIDCVVIWSAGCHQAIGDLGGGKVPRRVAVGGQFHNVEADAFTAL